MDPYAVLGVSPDAGREEVEAAYQRRLRLHDPDKQTSDDGRAAAIRFRTEVQQAYTAILGADRPLLPSGPTDPTGRPLSSGRPNLPPLPTDAMRRSPRRKAEPKPPLGVGGWLAIVVGTLVVLALVRAPLQYGLGIVPAAICWVLAVGVLIAGRSLLHDRRTR